MNWKIALVLVPFVSLVVAIGACGGDDCTTAEDKITSCAPTTSTTSTSSSGMTMIACTGSFQCKAECINRFTCDQINGNLPAYTTCITNCQGR
jgi:hypothetical protein